MNALKRKIIIPIWRFKNEFFLWKNTKALLKDAKDKKNRIFYFGIPAHANLGDLAQGVCIRKWLKKHYPNRTVVEIETNAVVNTHFSLINEVKKMYTSDDMIVFQSGYTTTDLGGYADEMHRAVMEALPQARMLMLPQTVFFQNEENKKRTSLSYNLMGEKMLFLARDRVSFVMANEMFPDVPQLLYPDIVTTMIGSLDYNKQRKGILFCCRDDEEKYYSDEEIAILMEKCATICEIARTDTTKVKNMKDIIKNAEQYILQEVAEYAKYKMVITDRYHGTILSLVAGTPVIIIKTTDHKVTTGAEWFKGVYDNHVYLAETLEEAYTIAARVYRLDIDTKLEPYFEKEYYDKLPRIFEEKVR